MKATRIIKMFDFLRKRKKEKPDVSGHIRAIRRMMKRHTEQQAKEAAAAAAMRGHGSSEPRPSCPTAKNEGNFGFSCFAPVSSPISGSQQAEQKKPVTAEQAIRRLSEQFYASPVDRPCFSDAVQSIMRRKGITSKELRKRILMDRRLYSKITGGSGYSPSKKTALSLCIGLELSDNEARDLLHTAGFSLSDSVLNDVVFDYAFKNRIYDLDTVNEILDHFGLDCIGV